MSIVRTLQRQMEPPLRRPLGGGGLPWDGGGGGLALSAPANTVAPVISSGGSVIGVGETLTGTNGTWTGSPAPSFTYRWERGATFGGGGAWSAIGGETTNAHVVVTADVLFSLTLVVIATNAAGSTEARSNTLIYLHATDLAGVAVWVSQTGVTQAAGTASAWASAYGSVSATLTAPAGANEPAYNATGGTGSRPLLTFDGTDDIMTGAVTKGSAWDTYETGFVGGRVATSATGDQILGYANTGATRFAITDRTAATIRWAVTLGANQDFTTDPDGVYKHFSGESAGGTQSNRVGGTIEVTGAATTTSRADGGDFSLGSATLCASFYLQACYVGPALTAGQRANLRALLTNATGVTS